jgi:hypothetical protein
LVRNYPDWIKQYLEYTQYSEAPRKFHFWTAVSVIAGALRRRAWIDQGYFQWVPNFYVVFVSPPGIVSKSTTADIGMSILREVPGIKFGPNSLTWQSLTKSLGESTEGVELPDGEIYPMSAVTLVGSELGVLLDFEDREMIDVFVDLWDGRRGVWQRQTKTQGEDKIENVYINILACTTPAWIKKNFDRYLLGGGFTSRTIFVYGAEKRHLEAYPGDRINSQNGAHTDMRLKLLQDLEQISQIIGPFALTEDAKLWGREWYAKHYARYRQTDPNDEGMTSFLARKQTQIHKLAIVLSASKRESRIIQKDDLEFANSVMDSVEADLPDIFGRIAERDEVADAIGLLQILTTRKQVDRQALYRMVFNRMSYAQFELALSGLVQSERVGVRQQDNRLIIYFKEPQSGAAAD